MHKKFITSIISCLALLAMLFLPTPVMAASFSMSASVQQVNPGGTFTVSLGGDCIGRVNLSVSNGAASKNAVWVEEEFISVAITAGGSGTVTVTATPETGFSDPNGDEYRPGPRTVSVKIVTPTQPSNPTTPPATTKPSTTTPTKQPQSNTQNTKPNSNSSTNNSSSENTSADISPDTSADTEQPTEDAADSDDKSANTDAPEPEESSDEDSCPKCPATWIQWSLAGFFGFAFLAVTGVLIYILYRQAPKKGGAHEKTK